MNSNSARHVQHLSDVLDRATMMRKLDILTGPLHLSLSREIILLGPAVWGPGPRLNGGQKPLGPGGVFISQLDGRVVLPGPN